MDAQATQRVSTAAVRGLIADAMAKSGVPAGDAAKVAELMLEADLIGADAHGVFRLPQYCLRLKLGGLNPRPNITVERTAPATALTRLDASLSRSLRSALSAALACNCSMLDTTCRLFLTR